MLTSCDFGMSRPILRIASLNSSRSSAFLIESILAPISSTPYFSSTPASASATDEIEASLAADGGQQRVGTFPADDFFGELDAQRLDVGAVGQVRIGHDRRRIRVDQDDLVAVAAQRLARLRAGVVELAGLADDDRAGADDQDAVDVVAARHLAASLFHSSISFTKSSNR